MTKEVVVLKVGGSVLSPSEDNIFDVQKALQIKNSLMSLSDRYQFVIITGGGALARKYQKILKDLNYPNREVNWIGLQSNNQNAVMLRCIFGEDCEDKAIVSDAILEDYPLNFTKTFLTVGAAEPGHSGDMDAYIIANRIGSKRVISLKDVDGVYSDNPRTNPDAKRFDKISWNQYRSEILKTDEFTPKMAVPVDPVASKMAQENGISFIVMKGDDFDNLTKAIKGEEFIGTVIGN